MIKKILCLIVCALLINTACYANNQYNKPHKPTYKERKEFDKMLDDRLKLTKEQKEYIKQTRPKHIAQMEADVKKMQNLHDKISEVYMLGIPKYQADIRTAPMKAELALVKQNIDKQRKENRKNFESILTKEQKTEFEKIKQEYALKRPPEMPKGPREHREPMN